MAIVFDEREYLDALRPPVYKTGGREYVGRILSIEEWWAFGARLQAWREAGASQRTLLPLMHDLFDAVFPREYWFLPRGRAAMVLRSRPFALQLNAFESFVDSLATAHGAKPLSRETAPTPGTDGTTASPEAGAPAPPSPT